MALALIENILSLAPSGNPSTPTLQLSGNPSAGFQPTTFRTDTSCTDRRIIKIRVSTDAFSWEMAILKDTCVLGINRTAQSISACTTIVLQRQLHG
jgi:hypothetical protein